MPVECGRACVPHEHMPTLPDEEPGYAKDGGATAGAFQADDLWTSPHSPADDDGLDACVHGRRSNGIAISLTVLYTRI
jgi:hypothetical protein